MAHTDTGIDDVTFNRPFPRVPTVLALSDGTGGAVVQVTRVDASGCRIEGRHPGNNSVANVGFHFIVIWPGK